MALEIDAFAVLRAIGAHHAAFGNIRSEALKAQGALTQKLRSLLVKQIKSSAASLDSLRDIREGLGAETFDLVVDGMKDTDIKAIVSKADKHHPDQKSGSSAWRRKHFQALITGIVQPSAKVTRTRRPTAKGKKAEKPKKKTPDFLFDESAGAVRKPQ